MTEPMLALRSLMAKGGPKVETASLARRVYPELVEGPDLPSRSLNNQILRPELPDDHGYLVSFLDFPAYI